MPTITRLQYPAHRSDRVYVFIDGNYCASLRIRTFQAMNLKEGDSISCEKLKADENFFWKKSYGEDAWKKEKVRLDRVKEKIESIDPNVVVNIVGFGADSTEMIEKHPDEKGKPDLDVSHKKKAGNCNY